MAKKMRKPQRYTVTLTFEVDIADAVLMATQNPNWQRAFYTMSREDTAAMIGRWLHEGVGLNRLEGFADRGEAEARIVPNSLNTYAEPGN